MRRLDHALALAVVGSDQADGAIDAMVAAAQALGVSVARSPSSGLPRMRRPTATAVSAARMALGIVGLGPHQSLAASALSRASRCTR